MNKSIEDKINELNQCVNIAISNRTKYLDSKMNDVAEVKIGNEAFDLNTGNSLGKVVELYRCHSNNLYDDSLTVNYRFDDGNNTSSQPGIRIGTYSDLIDEKNKNYHI